MAPDFSHNKGNRVQIYKTVVLIKIYPLHHGFSFYPSLTFLLFLSINYVRAKISKESIEVLHFHPSTSRKQALISKK